MNMAPNTYSATAPIELSSDDISKGIVRLNEIVANLTVIQRKMTESGLEKLTVTEPHLLSSSVDSLIQFVGQVEQTLAQHPEEE